VERRRRRGRAARRARAGGRDDSASSPEITLFLLLILVPSRYSRGRSRWQSLRTNLTAEFTSKGSAHRQGLANTAWTSSSRVDASTVQAQVDQWRHQRRGHNVMVYDQGKNLIAHTSRPWCARAGDEKPRAGRLAAEGAGDPLPPIPPDAGSVKSSTSRCRCSRASSAPCAWQWTRPSSPPPPRRPAPPSS